MSDLDNNTNQNPETPQPESSLPRQPREECNSHDWWDERSLGEKIVLGIGFGILGIGALALFGWVTMALWNWLMPDIFGLKRIDYWQAWGLLLLSCIFFKGFGSGGGNGRGTERKRKRHLRRYLREADK